MNLTEIYKTYETKIGDIMDSAFNDIFALLDMDTDIQLADDEMSELVYNLIEMYEKGETK